MPASSAQCSVGHVCCKGCVSKGCVRKGSVGEGYVGKRCVSKGPLHGGFKPILLPNFRRAEKALAKQNQSAVHNAEQSCTSLAVPYGSRKSLVSHMGHENHWLSHMGPANHWLSRTCILPTFRQLPMGSGPSAPHRPANHTVRRKNKYMGTQNQGRGFMIEDALSLMANSAHAWHVGLNQVHTSSSAFQNSRYYFF